MVLQFAAFECYFVTGLLVKHSAIIELSATSKRVKVQTVWIKSEAEYLC
jgi:hypothetical protein